MSPIAPCGDEESGGKAATASVWGVCDPDSGNGFALGGGPVPSGWLLFRGHGNLEGKRS